MSSGTQRVLVGRPGAAKPCAQMPVKILLPWFVCVLVGLLCLFQYEFTGAVPASVSQWPKDAELELAPDRPTAVLFVHPHCPCTAASIAELDRVLGHAPDVLNVIVVFPIPPGAAEDWIDGTNHTAARRLPGTLLYEDTEGQVTDRFGVSISGTVLAYGTDGALRFRGGLTASRGHEGPNTGSLALRSLASGETPAQSSSPVFGCALLSSETQAYGGTGQ